MTEKTKSWIYVYVSGILEIVWAVILKNAHVWWQWILPVAIVLVTMVLTVKAAKVLPTATVYVVFTGIAAVGTNLTDIFLMHEPVSALKIVFIVALIAGIVGLKLVGEERTQVSETGASGPPAEAGEALNAADAASSEALAAKEKRMSGQSGEVK